MPRQIQIMERIDKIPSKTQVFTNELTVFGAKSRNVYESICKKRSSTSEEIYKEPNAKS